LKPTISKRISNIERKAAPQIERAAEEIERRKAAPLEEWRQANCDRISWDLFALTQGPKLEHPDNYIHQDDDSEEDENFITSNLAYFGMIERVLRHGLTQEGNLDKSKMSAMERAFAACFERLFWCHEDADLLNSGIFNQAIALEIAPALHEGKMSNAEAVRLIDEHRGGPEWRQICDSNEAQAELDASLEIPTITEIPLSGRAWVDPGKWPK
jgi:hypothetical protein